MYCHLFSITNDFVIGFHQAAYIGAVLIVPLDSFILHPIFELATLKAYTRCCIREALMIHALFDNASNCIYASLSFATRFSKKCLRDDVLLFCKLLRVCHSSKAEQYPRNNNPRRKCRDFIKDSKYRFHLFLCY